MAVFDSPIFFQIVRIMMACNTHAIHFGGGGVCACAAKLQVNFPASCHIYMAAYSDCALKSTFSNNSVSLTQAVDGCIGSVP